MSTAAPSESEGLVFGQLDEEEEEEEVYSTPLSVTRASSRAADVPESVHSPIADATSPQAAAGDGAAATVSSTPALAADALHQQLAQVAGSSADANAQAATSTSPRALQQQQEQQQQQQQQQQHAEEELVGPGSMADAHADTLTADKCSLVEPQAAATTTSPPAAGDAPPAVRSSGSGLLSLAELSLNSPLPPASHSASASETSVSEEVDEPDGLPADAADAAAVASGVASQPNNNSSSSALEGASSSSSSVLGGGGGDAVTPPGARDSTSDSAGTAVQQQQPSLQLSPPCSPISTTQHGLERAASWQLQHAAAEAAGTATHPAPPRSDIDLARLSNTPASPHGEAGWAAWQQRRRHFFVLTAAGKPVYSRHGDEQALAGFMAVIQALLSVMTDQGDVIHSIAVGSSSIEFLLRGQLYLVGVSSRSEAQLSLRRQLELLYQSILMVATGGIERLLTRSPGYDVQQLLAGAKPSMNALISGYGDCPGWMLASVEPAPTAPADRQVITAALQDAVKACDCLFGILLVSGRVVAVERGPAAPALNVFDLLLLINFCSSNESLRHNETFVPVCLPNFQPNAFVHAYVNCLDDMAAAHQQQQEQQQQQLQQHPPGQGSIPLHEQQQQQMPSNSSSSCNNSRGKGTFLLLLSGSADAFHRLSAAQHSFVAAVTGAAGGGGGAGGVLGKVQAAAVQPGRGRVRVEALPAPIGGSVGSTPLWHAIIRYPQRHQHITLAYPSQLFSSRSQVKQLVRSYCRLYCAAYGQLLEANATATAAGPFGSGSSTSTGAGNQGQQVGHHAATAAAAGKAHKLLWVTSQRWVMGLLVDRDVEVFITLDPLTEKDVGLKVAETLKRLFGDRARRQDLLVPGL